MSRKQAMIFYALLVAGLGAFLPLNGHEEILRDRLKMYIKGKKAQIGVAVVRNGRDTTTVNNENQYPMLSVFKFHQALAVAHCLDRRNQTTNSLIYISKKDLKPDTYSPLRDKNPEGGYYLSVGELLTYTLQASDNNACDILFNHICSPAETDAYIRSLGIRNFHISQTEGDMHRNPQNSYLNRSTPLEAVRLLECFLTRPLFNEKLRKFIFNAMTTCQTGKDRLAAPLLNTDATFGHKTGSGDRNPRGQIIATNDIGFVLLPDKTYYTLAVFIQDSEESETDTARIIAEISDIVYRHFTNHAP